MKTLILTEGGRKIGFGHITRCASLSQAFKEKGIAVEFFVNGDRSVKELLRAETCQIFDWRKEDKGLFKVIEDFDAVVVDSYLASASFYKKISRSVKVPVYIDDEKRLDYPRGIVLNGSIAAANLKYPKTKGVTYLLGTKYTPLRKEFWHVPEKVINKRIKTILITFGGSDERNMTPKILKLLQKKYPFLSKRVIIGKGFGHIKSTEALEDKKTKLLYFLNAENIKKEMLNADITISAAGQTLYELARIGAPTIAVAVSDNQLNNARGWQRAGFVEYAGWWANKGLPRNLSACVKKLTPFTIRFSRGEISKVYIDGNGASIVADKILERIDAG